ncbi:NAD(P)-binding protein, partial [Dichomitus squalens LYAD-421 SS1]
VTGASGYIAAHVVQKLLESGYRVRGTARGKKVDFLREFWKANPHFEAVQIEDIATSDFTEALKDVDAVLHMASPLAGTQTVETTIKASIISAIEGTLNVLRQATAQGVTKFVLTSSWASLVDPDAKQGYEGLTLSEKDWGKTSREDLLQPGRSDMYVYSGTKILAEQAAWEFTKEHPEVDLATICPPFVYGPPILPLSNSFLGTPGLLYQLIVGEAGRPLPYQISPFWVDVRDVALAHVRALELPPLPQGADRQEKRFLIASPVALTFDSAVKHLYDTRPELRKRLPSLEEVSQFPGPLSKNDTTRAKEVLGITEYVDWRKTLEETIDALVEAEKTWA